MCIGKNIHKMVKVKIYSRSYCPFCRAAKEFFDKRKIRYELIEDDDSEIDKISKEINYFKIPKIFLNNKFIGGYSDLQILVNTGDFDKLLN